MAELRYPLGEHNRGDVRSQTGRTADELTVDDIRSGVVTAADAAVDPDTLPAGVTQTHVSLFDGTNCGIALDGKDVFSVQYHPEASPGPMDSHYLFERFAAAAKKKRA